MRLAPGRELPQELLPAMDTATRLAIGMIVYLAVDAAVLALVLTGSQAVLALIVEDVLESVAPVAFLVTKGKSSQEPDPDFPYGHHRDVTLGAFASSLALLGFGLVMVVISGLSLLDAQHPTIGTVDIFGLSIWRGWLALVWLVPAAAVPAWLVRKVKGPAREINNRVLHVAAQLLSADWLSTLAGVAGILGIAAGVWWLDSTAAVVISVFIIVDGYRTTKQTADMLLDRQPTKLGSPETVELVGELEREIGSTGWVGESQVRLRAHGQVYFGDAVVEIGDRAVSGRQLGELEARLLALDWRLLEMLVVPVEVLEHGSEPQRSD